MADNAIKARTEEAGQGAQVATALELARQAFTSMKWEEARDRVALEQDRAQAAQSRADMDFLAREIASLRMSVGELATRDYLRSELRAELRAILAELEGEDVA